jgi:hypothetical protein
LFTLPEKGGARRLCCQSEALLHYRWGIGKQNFYFFNFGDKFLCWVSLRKALDRGPDSVPFPISAS